MNTLKKSPGQTNEYYGLSTDVKPNPCPNASTFYEMDTSRCYMFDAQHNRWLLISNNSSGGSGSGGGNSGGSGCEGISDEDQLRMSVEAGLIMPLTDENGILFTDEGGKIYVL